MEIFPYCQYSTGLWFHVNAPVLITAVRIYVFYFEYLQQLVSEKVCVLMRPSKSTVKLFI